MMQVCNPWQSRRLSLDELSNPKAVFLVHVLHAVTKEKVKRNQYNLSMFLIHIDRTLHMDSYIILKRLSLNQWKDSKKDGKTNEARNLSEPLDIPMLMSYRAKNHLSCPLLESHR